MGDMKLHLQMIVDNLRVVPIYVPLADSILPMLLNNSWYPSPFGLQLARSILARPIIDSINLRDDRVIARPIDVAVNCRSCLVNHWLLASPVSFGNAPTAEAVEGKVHSQETIEQVQIRGESIGG